MKVFQILVAIGLFFNVFVQVQAAKLADKRVLMVVSSYGEMNEAKEIIKPGFEFDELAKSYAVFKHAGVSVDIASPKGGEVLSDEYDKDKSYNQLFLNDKKAMRSLSNSLKLSEVNASRYHAVFVVGGKGPMFDLHQDTHLQSIIRDVYEQDGIVSAVCHGPAALVDVKLSDGSYLIEGKRINGFTNQEEAAFGKKWTKQFAFLLEDKLRERGASFESAQMMLNHVAKDGRLITGQNPFSTADTALEVVNSLGVAPKPFTAFKDDATIKVVQRIIAGDTSAERLFADNIADYQVDLAAMYGFYRLKLAKTDSDVKSAVVLMSLTHKAMKLAPLDMALANGLLQLKRAKEAKVVLQGLLQANPEMKDAQALLEKVNAAL